MKKISSSAQVTTLSKFLAQAGVASRRAVVDLIKRGLITVNNVVIKNPAHKMATSDAVCYKKKPVVFQKKIYILLNKPEGYITTASDEQGRKTVLDLVKSVAQRLYPVGRLDRETTGLLVLTNDGNLAQKLAHPRYKVQKKYSVVLDRPLIAEDKEKIQKGLKLPDGLIQVDEIAYIPQQPHTNVHVTLHSGKNRIVRRVFEHLDYTVKALERVGYSHLRKKDLRVGQWRFLTEDEIKRLYVE